MQSDALHAAQAPGAADVEVAQTLIRVERVLLRIARRWLSPTVLGSAAALSAGCTRTAPAAVEAGSAQRTPPADAARYVPDAAPEAPADEARALAEKARAAEQALLAEQLAQAQKGEPLNVTTPAPGGGKPLKCRDDDLLFPVRANGLSIDPAPEYLELRTLRLAGEGQSAVEEFTAVDKLGTPCASATNAQCRAKLASSVSDAHASICVQMCVGYSVVTNQGDEVKQWSGPAALKQLLGDIVSENDALLLVASSGYQLECGNAARSTIRKLKDGFEVYATRITNTCSPVEGTRYRLHVSTQGELVELDKHVVSRSWDACIGRVPSGLMPAQAARGGSALGDFLADCARLEEASVVAFERMALELSAHAAPGSLIACADAAAQDERNHAAVVRQLAQTRGGRVQRAQVQPLPLRTLEQIALENAVEGCVRETYGALVGAYQAEHAQDLELRVSMTAIARDEARHAALSHALHAWLMPRLDLEARQRVEQAQRAAVHALRVGCTSMEREPWHAQVGLPPRQVAAELIEALTQELWQAAA